MAVESDADRLQYIDSDEFAVSVTMSVGTIYETTITGIFDNDYFEVDAGQVGVSTSVPMITCRTTDISNVLYSHKATISGDDYKVRDIQKDGTGMSVVVLEAV